MTVNLEEFEADDITARQTHWGMYYHSQMMSINELINNSQRKRILHVD
jgi:hypothetical protein